MGDESSDDDDMLGFFRANAVPIAKVSAAVSSPVAVAVSLPAAAVAAAVDAVPTRGPLAVRVRAGKEQAQLEAIRQLPVPVRADRACGHRRSKAKPAFATNIYRAHIGLAF